MTLYWIGLLCGFGRGGVFVWCRSGVSRDRLNTHVKERGGYGYDMDILYTQEGEEDVHTHLLTVLRHIGWGRGQLHIDCCTYTPRWARKYDNDNKMLMFTSTKTRFLKKFFGACFWPLSCRCATPCRAFAPLAASCCAIMNDEWPFTALIRTRYQGS